MIKRVLVDVKENKFIIANVEVIEKENKLYYTGKYKIEQINKGQSGISGLSFERGTWIGENGSLERYKGEHLAVVLQSCESKLLYLCYNSGSQELILLTLQDILWYNQNKIVIANGKVLRSETGKHFLSPIKGFYIEVCNLEKFREVCNLEKFRKGVGNECNTRRVEIEKEYERKGISGNVQKENSREGKEWSYFDRNRNVCQGASAKGAESISCRDRVVRELGRLNLGLVEDTPPDTFLDITAKVKSENPHGCCVDVHSLEDYKSYKKLISFGKDACIAVKKDGDVVNVVKSSKSEIKGFAKMGLTMAIRHGGTKLDCYNIDGGLPTLYCKCGFVPICRCAWYSPYAPEDWEKELGEPDIVFMAFCGDSADDVYENYGKGYKSFEDYDYESLPLFTGEDGYGQAEEYRDRILRERKIPNPHTSLFKSVKSKILEKEDRLANNLQNIVNGPINFLSRLRGK